MRIGIKLILISILFNIRIHAQIVNEYTFDQSINNYIGILGGNVVASGSNMENQYYTQYLPFTFNLGPNSYTSLSVNVNGFLVLGSTASINQYPIASTSSNVTCICPFSADLNGVAESEIRYLATGASPSRVVTIEWRNMDANHSDSTRLTFQVKLFETTNEIKFSYNQCHSTTSISTEVGIRFQTNTNFLSRKSSSGNWSSTTSSSNCTDRINYTPGNDPSSGLTFKYLPPVLVPCDPPTTQPTNLTATSNYTSLALAYQTGNNKKCLVVQTPDIELDSLPHNGIIYSYGNLIGNGKVIYSGNLNSTYDSYLTENTWFRYAIFEYNDIGCNNGPLYNVVNPLTGRFKTLSSQSYTFLPSSGSADFQVESNWFPSRITPRPNDTLIFQGGNVNVTNIPNQEIDVLQITGNGVYTFNGTNTYLTIDKKLCIENNSNLVLTFTTSGGIKFNDTQTVESVIKGQLELTESSYFDVSYSHSIIYGVIKQSGPYTAIVNTGNKSNLVFEYGSLYLHARNGGGIPLANYKSHSTVKIIGVTSESVSIPSGSTLGNFIYDCPNQSIQTAYLRDAIDTVLNDYHVVNTNGKWLSNGSSNSTVSTTIVLGDFIQDNANFIVTYYCSSLVINGNLILNNGQFTLKTESSISSNVPNVLHVKGNIIQSPSVTINSIKYAGIIFEGTIHQEFTMNGSISGSVSIVLNNSEGATLNNILALDSASRVTISKGHFDGPGRFQYNQSNSSLIYSGNDEVLATSIEWPDSNGPIALKIDLTGAGTTNRIQIPGERSIHTLDLKHGILLLNDYDLIIRNCVLSNYSTTTGISQRMVAINGNGKFNYTLYPDSITTARFPIGTINPNDVPVGSDLEFFYGDNSVERTIRVGVNAMVHPNSNFTNSLHRYWSFEDTGIDAPMIYAIKAYFQQGDADDGICYYQPKFWNGNVWNNVEYVYGNCYLQTDTLLISDNPLNSFDLTGGDNHTAMYHWTGAINQDYQVAGNWSPSRIHPSPFDWIEISTGQTDTLSNVPSEIVAKFSIINNSNVYFQASNLSTESTVNYLIDFNSAIDSTQLTIEAGSSLHLEGMEKNFQMKFGFGKNEISGILAVKSEIVTNKFVAYNSKTTVTSSGKLININEENITSTSSCLFVYGTLELQFPQYNSMPQAFFGDSSTVIFSGKIASTVFSLTSQFSKIRKLIIDCPLQENEIQLYGIPEITDSLIVISSGTANLKLIPYSNGYKINNYYQTGGNVLFTYDSQFSHNFFGMSISGNFIQVGGTCSTGIYNSTNSFGLEFKRQDIQQSLIFNSQPLGGFNYIIRNPQGIQVSLINNQNGLFEINNLSKLTIATYAPQPFISNLELTYANSSTLVIDSIINNIISTDLLPLNTMQINLVIDVGEQNSISLPFDVQLKSLYLKSGNLIVNEHSISLGDSTVTGIINYNENSQNHFVVLTTGSITKWYKVGSIPISSTNFQWSTFPVLIDGMDNTSSIWFNASTSLVHSGTIQLSFLGTVGLNENQISIIDNGVHIQQRINRNWIFETGNGIQFNDSTLNIKLSTTELFNSLSAYSIHIIHGDTIAGAHVQGLQDDLNYVGIRSQLSMNDLTPSGFSIGSSDSLSHIIYSVQNGNWEDGTTWNQGLVPNYDDFVLISGGTTVDINQNSACKILNVSNGGTIQINQGMLTISDKILSNGTFNISGGNILLGPEGGGKSPFVNYGNFIIDSGGITVNGYIDTKFHSSFHQNGGEISIDGNAGNVLESSVSSQAVLTISTIEFELNSGTLKLIDPCFYSNDIKLDLKPTLSNFSSRIPNAGSDHTFIIGDGFSTSTSNRSFNFSLINSYNVSNNSYLDNYIIFNHVIINGTPSVVNRKVMTDLRINGDFTMNNYEAYFQGWLSLGGNLLVNEGASFVDTDLYFYKTNDLGLLENVTVPQYVTGDGNYLNNSYPSSTRGFNSISIMNSSYEGVIFDIGDIIVNEKVVLYKGKLNIGYNTLTCNILCNIYYYSASYIVNGNGWLIGKYKMPYSNNNFVSIPIGTLTDYFNITLYDPNYTIRSFKLSLHEGDDPLIAQSGMDSTKTLNYTATFEQMSMFGQSDQLDLNIYWPSNAIDASSNPLNFVALKKVNNDWIHVGSESPQVGQMTISNVSNLYGTYQLGETIDYPYILNQTSDVTICLGENALFSVETGYYASFNYQWQQLIGNSWIDLQEDSVFMGVSEAELFLTNPTIALDSSFFRCRISNSNDSLFSEIIPFRIHNYLQPGNINISTSNTEPVCSGTEINFAAITTNLSNDASLNWYRNGILIASGTNSFSSSALLDNDIIRCYSMNTNACSIDESVLSNSLTMDLINKVTPSISIYNLGSTTVYCENETKTFHSNGSNLGTTPEIQWFENGTLVNIGNTYSLTITEDSTLLFCSVISSNTCTTTPFDTSNTYTIIKKHTVIPEITITSDDDYICPGDSVTYTAQYLNGGPAPQFSWYRNNVLLSTSTTPFYSSNSIQNGNIISCSTPVQDVLK